MLYLCHAAGDVDVVIIVPEVRQDKAASEVHLAVRQKLLEKVGCIHMTMS